MRSRDSITRREFVYLSAATAGMLTVSGCASGGKHAPVPSGTSRPLELLDRAMFERLVQTAFDTAEGDGVLIKALQSESRWCKHAAHTTSYWEVKPTPILQISVSAGDKIGWATAEFTEQDVVRAVREAESALRDADTDAMFSAVPDGQRYLVLPTFRELTARADRARHEEVLEHLASLIHGAGMAAEVTLNTTAEAVGVAASTGLLAFERRTTAEYRGLAASERSQVSLVGSHRALDDLVNESALREELARARIVEIAEAPPAGSPMILGPRAVARIMAPLLMSLDASDATGGTGPLADQVGQELMDARLTLRSRPDHPDLLGTSFDSRGAATDARAWIDGGVLRRVCAHIDVPGHRHLTGEWGRHAWCLTGTEPVASDLAGVIAICDDALLVTDIGDVWPVDAERSISMYVPAAAYRVQGGEDHGTGEWRAMDVVNAGFVQLRSGGVNSAGNDNPQWSAGAGTTCRGLGKAAVAGDVC